MKKKLESTCVGYRVRMRMHGDEAQLSVEFVKGGKWRRVAIPRAAGGIIRKGESEIESLVGDDEDEGLDPKG
jgi:hypothetical protein